MQIALRVWAPLSVVLPKTKKAVHRYQVLMGRTKLSLSPKRMVAVAEAERHLLEVGWNSLLV
jgi:hypothetical protein